jgi:hypothetical protein
MKLSQMLTVHAVGLPGQLQPHTNHVSAERHHVELETGPEGVAIKSARGVVLVPLANVVHMVPEPAKK